MGSKRGPLWSLAAAVALIAIACFVRKCGVSAVTAEVWCLGILERFARDLGIILFLLSPFYWVAVEFYHLLRSARRDSHNRLVRLSCFSLLSPFLALGLCLAPHRLEHMLYIDLVMTARYAILGSSIIATIVLLADAWVKEWRLTWKPIIGLGFSGSLYAWTKRMPYYFRA